MRTISTARDALLSASTRSDHVRVSVHDYLGAYVDLSDLLGFDWTREVSFEDSVDAAVMTATVSLVREQSGISLDPIMEGSEPNNLAGSYHALIDIGRQIKIEVAVSAFGATGSDWINVFEGVIDEWQIGGKDSLINLTCRDLGGRLQDVFIQDQAEYGTAAGRAVESVIQDILTAEGTGVTLWCPTSPSWNVLIYQQQKMSVMDAIQQIVAQFGWLCKYRWDSGTSAWRLKLFDPNRSKATVDRTFGPSEYYDVSSAGLSLANVRNKVRIVYTDSATNVRTSTTAQDAASIAKYGTRFCEICEDGSSNIDSAAEAAAFAAVVLADLKDPLLNQSVVLPAFWPIETGDRFTWEANGIHYDTDQTLSAYAWVTRYTGGTARTTVSVQGQPSGGYLKWIQIEARPGVTPTADEKGPLKRSGITRYSSHYGLGTYHLWGDAERNTLLPNPDFALQSRVTTGSGQPPDSWEVDAGTWGPAADIYVSTSVQRTGARSLHFRNTATTPARAKSDLFPVTEGDLYVGSAWLYSDSVNAGDAHYIYVTWYQSDKSTSISSSTIYNSRMSGSVWTQVPMAYLTAPSNARWARVFIQKTTAASHNLYIDAIRLRRGFAAFTARFQVLHTQTVPNATTTTMEVNSELIDYGGGYNPATYVYTVPFPGLYQVCGWTAWQNVRVNTRFYTRLEYRAGGAGAWSFIGMPVVSYNVSTGNYPQTPLIAHVQAFNAGDQIRLSASHNEAPNLVAEDAGFWGQQLAYL